MKKSEMIQIMVDFYVNHHNKIGYGWSERDFMHNLLVDLEIEGMLPPPVEKELIRPLELDTCSEFSIYYNTEDINWEPEDD